MRKGFMLWVRTDSIENSDSRHAAVIDAVQRGFSEIVVRRDDLGMTSAANFIPITIEGGEVAIDGRKAGRFLRIRDAGDMPADGDLVHEFLVVETSDWKVIPVENLIAQCSSRNIRLIASVGSVDEARLFLQTLEKGVDGLLVEPSGIPSLEELSRLTSAPSDMFALEKAEILSVGPSGMGDRVCVDTCSLLAMGEGMLVGSQSSVFFLVHSETIQTGYVNARPFRVNAGPVHSYIVLPGGKTGYLSELSSGSEALAVSRDGSSRSVTVGRVKIERRPLLLVRARTGDRDCSIILQNAETVNLCTPDGVLPVTSLKKGDEVLVHVEEGARHFGMKVSETIDER